MKSRHRSLILTLPTLMILGIHLVSQSHAVAASAGFQDLVNHEIASIEFIRGTTYDLGVAHANHLLNPHTLFDRLTVSEHVSDNRLIHAYGSKGSSKTWGKDQWKRVGKWDEQARQDMHARIARNGLGWTPRDDSFGKQANWLPGWELRWWSFSRNDGSAVWAYHARSKSSGQRYTSFTEDVNGKLQNWEVAR